MTDPRYYQIATLSSLIAWGSTSLGFGIRIDNALAIVAVALVTQWVGTRLAGLARFDPLSAIITSLSLTLLLRTDLVWIAAVAATLAVGSKFLLRANGKHIFNPANFAIVVLILLSDRAWISSGQWGSTSLLAIAVIGLGLVVLSRARRFETTLFFLGSWATLLLARAVWLGDPLAIPLHQLQNGALLVFAFFMISDPVTAPNSPLGRALFGTLVAVVAYVIQFYFYLPSGPVLALIGCALAVPLIDRCLNGSKYQWRVPHKGATPCES
ncbi:MAG: RnfABCDGE type electron transport complex subunit D [Pseudomonadota bacterium]